MVSVEFLGTREYHIIPGPAVLLEQSPAFSSPNYIPILFCTQDYHQPILLRSDSTSNKQPKMSQNTITESNNCLNTTSSYNTTTSNVWNNYSVTNDLSPLLTWLSPLDPGLRHSDIQERRVNDVGGWLMDTEEFRRWCGLGGEGEGDEAVLFCYGNPGVGKTFIR